jgi:hypothetical protein
VDEQSGNVMGWRGHRNIVEHLAQRRGDALLCEVLVPLRTSCQRFGNRDVRLSG